MRLALVALASLVAGAASAGVAAVAWEQPAAAFVVSTGHYGDLVTYATHWQQEVTGSAPSRTEVDGVTRWTVDETRAPDETGQVFDGVRLRETFSSVDGDAHSSQVEVDLRDRAIKRFDDTRAYESEVEVGLPTNNAGTMTLLGPSFGQGVGTLHDLRFAAIADTPSSPAAVLLLQGIRLAEGRPVVLESTGPAPFQDRTREVSVVQVGQVDGTPMAVLGIHEDGIATWVHTPRLQSDWEVRQVRYEWNAMVWISQESAYPVRIEETVRHVGTGEYGQATSESRRTLSLLEVRGGTRPIPWGSATQVAPPSALEWTPGPLPSSEGWRGPMSLEAGLAAASSPQLVGFASWKANHPDHRLVGFYLQPVAPEMTPTLNLAFGAPSSPRLFQVTIEQRPGPSFIVREGLPDVEGVTTLPAVQPYLYTDMRAQVVSMIEWAPQAWPSLATLDERWGLVADQQAFAAGPTSVQWGLQCACPLGEEELRRAATTLRYGRWARPAATESPFEDWGTWDHAFFDPHTGDIQSSRSSTMAFQALPLATAGAQVTAPPVLKGPAAPEVAPWVIGFSASVFIALALSWKTLRSAGLLLYARLLPAELLKHPMRQQFLESIRASPGIGAPRLTQLHGVPWSTTMHHLRRMESAGYVTSERVGRHRRYFAAGKTDAQMRKVLAVIQNERTRHVLDLVREHPGIHRTALAEQCKISVPSILWHLDRLADVGLVRSERSGRSVFYFRGETPLGLVTSQPLAVSAGAV